MALFAKPSSQTLANRMAGGGAGPELLGLGQVITESGAGARDQARARGQAGIVVLGLLF